MPTPTSPVGKHGADDEEAERQGLQDVDTTRHVGGSLVGKAGHEGAVESERDECRAADGEALADSGRGVARRVESVGLLADLSVVS